MSKQTLKDPKIRTGFGKILSVFNQDAELYKGLSEELKSELANTQSELQTRMNILETASIMSEADLKGNIIYVNDKFCEVAGYTREEVMGKPHNILRHPDMPADAFKDMWATIGRGHVWNGIVRNKRKDGSSYWVNATVAPVLGDNGKPVKYVSVRFDITEQVKSELDLQAQLETLQQQDEEIRQTAEQIQQQDEELRQNLEELNAMNDDLIRAQLGLRAQINALNSAAIVSETDVKGNITYVNDMFCKISG
jgi:PAS domain S-box-containing protein